jgi:Putative zinc-finger
MTCADFEILICDYVDGTLAPAQKAELERHLSACAACAELARDSAAAVSFIERAADVEPPPELMARILFDAPWTKGRTGGIRQWLAGILHPVLQPRLVMGMAMTILFLAMLAQFVGPGRRLRQQDFEPARVWAALDNSVYRGWQRTMKFYESIRFLYQVRNQLQEWQQQQDEEERAVSTEKTDAQGNADSHKLPLRSSPRLNPAPQPSESTGKSQ